MVRPSARRAGGADLRPRRTRAGRAATARPTTSDQSAAVGDRRRRTDPASSRYRSRRDALRVPMRPPRRSLGADRAAGRTSWTGSNGTAGPARRVVTGAGRATIRGGGAHRARPRRTGRERPRARTPSGGRLRASVGPGRSVCPAADLMARRAARPSRQPPGARLAEARRPSAGRTARARRRPATASGWRAAGVAATDGRLAVRPPRRKMIVPRLHDGRRRVKMPIRKVTIGTARLTPSRADRSSGLVAVLGPSPIRQAPAAAQISPR